MNTFTLGGINITIILFYIFIFLLINTGIPALLTFMNIDVVDTYLPFQIFASAMIVLSLILPRKVNNIFTNQ
jgi:hypothetical protein